MNGPLTACSYKGKIKHIRKQTKLLNTVDGNMKLFSDYENLKLKLLITIYDFSLRQTIKPFIKNVQVTAK